jgi:xanthine dehydrogenase small subunit
MLRDLLFFVNGRRHVVRGPDAFLSLSDYLRRIHGLVGTKIVCSEGDCGACTVLVGRPAADGRRLVYRPVDSCIQFMFQLEGTHIVTVEGLGDESQPSAVQMAMIECHGSQCGFCTPGFVVAMTGLLEEHDSLDESQLRCGLTGNLCRCTGYTPILEAGTELDAVRHERVEQLYPSGPMIAEFAPRCDENIEVQAEWNGRQHVLYSPTNESDALDFLKARPDATIVAGATDIGVRINKSLKVPPTILDLNRLETLNGILIEEVPPEDKVKLLNADGTPVSPSALILGARLSWSELEQCFERYLPEFHKIIRVFGAPQIRNVGTIGGNIANASPIADSLPFLFVMEAELWLDSADDFREVNINDFYQGYKKFDLRPGELIASVRVPLPAKDELLKLYRVSRRHDLDIASFTAAIRLRLDGDMVSDAKIAFGAVGPTVIRARRTEQFLRGRPLDEDTMRAAGDVAVDEIAPISDVRGAADYRYQLTRNILLKFYYDVQTMAVPA